MAYFPKFDTVKLTVGDLEVEVTVTDGKSLSVHMDMGREPIEAYYTGNGDPRKVAAKVVEALKGLTDEEVVAKFEDSKLWAVERPWDVDPPEPDAEQYALSRAYAREAGYGW